MEQTYDCIIMANGQFPSTSLLLSELEKAPALIVCDGAIRPIHELGLSPVTIIGDLDSIPPDLQLVYAGKIHSVSDQETNDLTKAVRLAHHSGYKRLLILGATGLREDHTLGNISLLIEYAGMFERVEMRSDYGMFTPLLASATLESYAGQQISLFSFQPGGRITSCGLKWDVADREFTNWWQGTLNEAKGTSFMLALSYGAKLIVYRASVDDK